MSKTTSEHVKRWRENHYKALAQLSGQDGLKVWRKLRRVEEAMSWRSTCYCNGTLSEEKFEECKENTRERVARIMGGLPRGFYLNCDPRGYALKLDPTQCELPVGMHRDWGGYGILAADIE